MTRTRLPLRSVARGVRRSQTCAAFAVSLLAAGCAYTANSLLPSYVRTIAIPAVQNQSSRAGIEQQLTDALLAAYTRDNHLRVVSPGTGDAELSVAITGYKNEVFSYSASEQPSEYQVAIAVSAVFTDRVKNRELWKNEALTSTERYRLTQASVVDPLAQSRADSVVIRKIADDVVARTVQGW